MKKKYLEFDFLKFVLMIGMMFRHLPLYLYQTKLIEYSIQKINLYSLFIPVTAGFVSILGLTLGISNKNIDNDTKIYVEKSRAYFIKFMYFFNISFFVGILNFYFDRNYVKNFLSYFFLYQKGQNYKPGFYILLAISFLFLIVSRYLRIKTTTTKNIYIYLSIIISFVFKKYYSLYYLSFGLLFFVLGLRIKVDEALDFFKDKRLILLSGFLYLVPYLLFGTNEINYFMELYLLIIFIAIFLGISNFSVIKRRKDIISTIAKNVFLYYIIHVLILNFVKTFFMLKNMYQVAIVSIMFFILINIGIMKFKVLKNRVFSIIKEAK